MYIPPSNAEHDAEVMLGFIQANPFGALVTSSPEGLFATHLPLVLDRSRGPFGTLVGHLARANAHHRLASAEGEALVIFQGPDAYITPSWYPAKAEHARVVPTWNYVAVHAHGTPRFTDDPSFLLDHLHALTGHHESAREHPWAVEDAPAEFIHQQMKAIVGVEIEITRLEGKWKMSQNRSDADIDGVVRGLAESPHPAHRAVSDIVQARRPARG